MNIRRNKHKASIEVSTASLNDIMFFLLLFFLIASTITNPNVIKLLLPKSDSGQVLSKKTVNLTIDSTITYFIENEPIPFDEIFGKLQQLKHNTDELTLVLYVDKSVAIEEVVKVMDLANKLQLKIVLATEPKKQ